MKETTKRRLRSAWVASLLVLAATPSELTGQSSSDEAAPFLLFPIGAGASALGRAVTAMPGPESAFWNPAGLAGLDRSTLLVGRSDVGVGPSTAGSVLLARPGVGALGFSYLMLDIGDQDHTDRDRNLLGIIRTRNHLAVLSAAARLLPGLDAGASFKVIQLRRSCRGQCAALSSSSTGYAVDLGVQLAPVDGLPFRIGAMVAHLGPSFQLENASQSDPLPTRLRIAAAYDVLSALGRPGLAGWLTVEVQDRPGYRGGSSMYLGAEVAAGAAEALFLRAGYATDSDLPGGASVGFGLRLERFEISVAKSLAARAFALDGEPLDVSLAIGF